MIHIFTRYPLVPYLNARVPGTDTVGHDGEDKVGGFLLHTYDMVKERKLRTAI